MVTALYRRYRPENFAEMIGQSQVTDPLMTALRTNRVNHAYLFSGPRGCGKTTSARILARCLNCAEGPTDKPCGVCASCVELSRDGMGSLDVVEIDAASHGGVDDARDLRERAIFAPARDRYKIFIIDEAHMVTSGGFNALLKIVEEPPEHIKFIFATTEPDKVIGTIRSRTHHYPFRLIPPAQLLEYVQQLCETEGVEVAPGVLPLVVRAGGGSARDTLSLLDQLIAGSENNRVEYERAVALLGYTHGALLSEVIDAIGAHDGAAAFDAVDRVIQTGQDPRRFVEDLLERLRDVIIVSATRESASSVLRGVPAEEIEGMRRQAALFGHAELSRVADIVNDALTEMTGATSPRLHLELMIARTLVPASDDSERGALVRVERLERRIGVDQPDSQGAGAPAVSSPTRLPAAEAPRTVAQPATAVPTPAPVDTAAPPVLPAPEGVPAASEASASPVAGDGVSPAPTASAAAGEVSLQQLKDAWPEILEAVQKAKMTAWLVVFTAQVRALDGDVLTLAFPSENDVASFKERSAPGQGVSEYLRQAIVDVLGLRVKYIARVDSSLRPEPSSPDAASPTSGAPDAAPSALGAAGAAAGATAPSSAGSSSSGTSSASADGWAPAALSSEPSPAPTWSTPGVSDPGSSIAPPETSNSVTAPPASTPSAAASAPADRPPSASTGSGAAPTASSAATGTPGAAPTSSGAVAASSSATTTSSGAATSAPSARSGSGANERAQRGPSPAVAPTTSWDVAVIPTSSDEEPPPFDEPLPSDEPDLPPDLGSPETGSIADVRSAAPDLSSTEARSATDVRSAASERAARPSGAPDPAARPGALRFEAAPENDGEAPATPAPAGPASSSQATVPAPRASASAGPSASAGGRARYGEAVVREILGANFIEEQPLPGREG